MADLTTVCGGIRSPNPFWLASGPPTNTGDQVMRAFDQGWGGAVWKTLGEPIVNVSSRLGGLHRGGQRLAGLNNIELITDRPLEVNLREIELVAKRYPEHALVVSAMVASEREAWHDIARRIEDSGARGIELNFGCPHGMSERGMGAAIGQVPEYTRMITEWVKEVSTIPVLVKLTPNVSDVRPLGQAAAAGGADGLALINTINSVIGVDLETLRVQPSVDGASSHGGFCGPAVKPIALHMVSRVALDPGLPISGIGGISTWADAAEFILLGASTVQVCTAVMHRGFRLVEDLADGLSNWMEARGFDSIETFRGQALPQLTHWNEFNLSYKVVARIDAERCIGCNVCYIACEDGAHQCIHAATEERPAAVVDEDQCVGCNLCQLVCPVERCIEMVEVDSGRPRENWAELQARRAAEG